MHLFRVSNRRHANDLTGEGARRYGGRWNSVGIAMIYTASSISLAMLEALAHSTGLPEQRVLSTLEVPDDLPILRIHSVLPAGWNARPHSIISQAFGDKFIRQGKYLAMGVPSVITPLEDNILINPNHIEINRLKIIRIEELPFDPRLK